MYLIYTFKSNNSCYRSRLNTGIRHMRTAERKFRSDVKVASGEPGHEKGKYGSKTDHKWVYQPEELEENLKKWYRQYAVRVAEMNLTRTERKCFMFHEWSFLVVKRLTIVRGNSILKIFPIVVQLGQWFEAQNCFFIPKIDSIFGLVRLSFNDHCRYNFFLVESFIWLVELGCAHIVPEIC